MGGVSAIVVCGCVRGDEERRVEAGDVALRDVGLGGGAEGDDVANRQQVN